MKHDAILRRWSVIPMGDRAILMGRIYDDSKQRFEDGTPIRTSFISLVHPSKDGITIQTRNTRYLLEDAYVVPV